VNGISVDEIAKIVAAALDGDRQAESRMLVALRPGVLAVLRFGAFHRWIDAEDLTQETLHVVVERVRAAPSTIRARCSRSPRQPPATWR